MTKSQAIQWKTACWIAVGGFTAASAGFGWWMHQLFAEAARPGSLGMCANCVTDPLGAILSSGTPISIVGFAGFVCLLRRGVAGWSPVVISLVLTLGCTIGLLVFGFRFFRDLDGAQLSEIVWWLRPFGAIGL